jgi:hypothetical protein
VSGAELPPQRPRAVRPFVLIASIASITFVVFAVLARVPTYRVAPLFLIPIVWAFVLLRRRLHLHAGHFLLVALALVLHDLGAFGFYQRSFAGVSFDVYVHFYFALAAAFVVHRFLARSLPLRGWALRAATVLCIMGFGGVHEVMEYGTYLALPREQAMLKDSSYRYDTSRDLTSNFAGVVLALVAIAIVSPARKPTEPWALQETARTDGA